MSCGVGMSFWMGFGGSSCGYVVPSTELRVAGLKRWRGKNFTTKDTKDTKEGTKENGRLKKLLTAKGAKGREGREENLKTQRARRRPQSSRREHIGQ